MSDCKTNKQTKQTHKTPAEIRREELSAQIIDRCQQGVKTEKSGNIHRHSERHLNMNMTKKLSKHHATQRKKVSRRPRISYSTKNRRKKIK